MNYRETPIFSNGLPDNSGNSIGQCRHRSLRKTCDKCDKLKALDGIKNSIDELKISVNNLIKTLNDKR